MGDGIPPGTGVHPERPPAAMASATHRRPRTRSQIAILDIDLANALSVAPAPRSWKAAEERVLAGFGGSFQTPMSAETNNPSPHKGYFVDDLNASNDSLSSACSNSTFNDDTHPPSMSDHRSPSPEVFGTVPVHCVRVIEPGSRRNSAESYYAYFIEDGDPVYDTPEQIHTPRPASSYRGRFREVVGGRDSDATPDSYRPVGLPVVENASSLDQDSVPPPVTGKRPSGDKGRKRVSQVIVDASKRSKRRMSSCTIQ